MNNKNAAPWLLSCSMALIAASFVVPQVAAENASRITLSLNGQWDVEDSVNGADIPRTYSHKAPVPGLTHSSVPAFPDADQYQSRELLGNLVRQGRFSQADYDKLGDARGVSHQDRNYFWYKKTFNAPAQNSVAILKVNKAQFGIVVVSQRHSHRTARRMLHGGLL